VVFISEGSPAAKNHHWKSCASQKKLKWPGTVSFLIPPCDYYLNDLIFDPGAKMNFDLCLWKQIWTFRPSRKTISHL